MYFQIPKLRFVYKTFYQVFAVELQNSTFQQLQNSLYGEISKIIQNRFKITFKKHINSYLNPRRFDVLTISTFLRTFQSLVGCQKISALFYSVWKIMEFSILNKTSLKTFDIFQILRGAQKCNIAQNIKPSRIWVRIYMCFAVLKRFWIIFDIIP